MILIVLSVERLRTSRALKEATAMSLIALFDGSLPEVRRLRVVATSGAIE